MKKNYANPIVKVIRVATEGAILVGSVPEDPNKTLNLPTDDARNGIWLD